MIDTLEDVDATLTAAEDALTHIRSLVQTHSRLEDRSARPLRRPRAMPERGVRRVLRLRRRLRVGPHRLGPLLGHPRSTVYGVLRRQAPLPRWLDTYNRRRPTPLSVNSAR